MMKLISSKNAFHLSWLAVSAQGFLRLTLGETAY